MDVKAHSLSGSDSLRAALAVLENAPVKLCIIVDEQGRLERTVTDGDIRRGLLSGIALDQELSSLTGCAPVTMCSQASRAELIERLENSSVDAIVLVDDEQKPTGIASRSDLFKPMFLSPPHMGDLEAAFVDLAFEENYIAPAGTNLSEFEASLQKYSGGCHAIAVSSGTAGLHLALRVLDVSDGDRVYVSDMTFAASVQPILYERAVPVLIDCDPADWNMSPDALERALDHDSKRGKLPKAIVVVHLYGQSADMDRIMMLADRYNVPIVEDAAESLGASWNGASSGSHGAIGVYSFNGNKIITTSGGGAMVSNHADLIDRARSLSTQARDPADHYQHREIAYNYRMSNVLAGIGRGQLAVLEDRVQSRRAVFDRYFDALSDIEGISFQAELPGSYGNRWLTVVNLDASVLDIHPYVLMRNMRRYGIETRPAWKPMSLQPLLGKAELWTHSGKESVAHGLFYSSLCLPSGSAMRTEEQDAVIQILKKTLLEREST
ncbi:MAG: aminotransferase class I/II-fold pyridoxal phosphate-dependent enzyme [Hyphomicrobiales bacterium]